LKEALAEAKKAEETRDREIDAERQRIDRRERLIRDQFDACDPKYHLVYDDLQDQLNTVLGEKKEIEKRLELDRLRPRIEMTETTLTELCDLGAQVPGIWYHQSVSDHERKEILRCLIQSITVRTTPETIDGTIRWLSRSETSFHVYRRYARYNLIKELHTQGYNTREILDRLERGETSTGQDWKLHPESLYKWYGRLKLNPHSKPSWFRALQEEAVQLHDKGTRCREIADLLNSRGLKTLTGRQWSWKLVFNIISAVPRKPDPLEKIHLKAFLDAEARGLNFVQMAKEFNGKGIPRLNKNPWHPVAVQRKWRALKRTRS